MSIDKLDYQLKYKRDPAVLDLLRAYESTTNEVIDEQEERGRIQDELDDLSGTVTDLKSQISQAVEELKDISSAINKTADDPLLDNQALRTALRATIDEISALIHRLEF